ncbi:MULTISPECIES: tetratricopeptide repeat protein [unclassified Delftia]|uniref:tetratricopeptide repeat protein n=1 Tax=unclassified Delftia TaxID=2613839 RepID=UPI0018FF8D87|nr:MULTISPECIES: tetratricopeptide repeat protein [unclassified Delftia]MBK0112592.1 tetratricopeptide repeat protein [Delftia sp. S65]MBK0118005.1 tetratricopeptide repeat protein [Delftia sp. S67]MBK0131988.1 tetratricopeptide repeat protein [Delftia sp. S66]
MDHRLRLQGLAVAAALAMGSATAWALPGKTAATIETESPEPPSSAAASAEDDRAALNAELFYEILVGEIAASEGALGDAQAMMMEAARTSGSEQLYRRGTELALQSRSGERALANARAWLDAFPQSRDANRFVLQILVALNRIADTGSYLKREIEATPAPSKPATYLGITQLYNNASDKALAADVVEQAMAGETDNPASGPLAWATIGHMRLGAGQKAAAMQAVQKAQALTPDTGPVALLSMELLEAGMPEAEPIVKRYLAKNPSAQMRMAYARVLLGQQRMDEARQQLVSITVDSPDYAEAWATLAALQLQSNDVDAAQASTERFGKLVPQIPAGVARSAAQSQYYLLQSQIAEKRGKFAEADALLRRIDDAPNLLSVQARRAALLARQGKLKEARALIEAVPASGPSQQRLKRLAEVQLLRDANQNAQAYALQAELQKQDPEDAELAYDTALLAERIGKHDEMERLLRGIIARQPDFQHAYNALGYSFAERGIHLDEAEKLVGKALEMSPGDPFITDSLAWVKFRRGDLDEALRLLESAYASRPDVEIAAHLGEVLWAKGDRERAQKIWRQGLATSPDNTTLRETLRRLGVSL